jgi:hypothetical protein
MSRSLKAQEREIAVSAQMNPTRIVPRPEEPWKMALCGCGGARPFSVIRGILRINKVAGGETLQTERVSDKVRTPAASGVVVQSGAQHGSGISSEYL